MSEEQPDVVRRAALTTRDHDEASRVCATAFGPHRAVLEGDPSEVLLRVTADETDKIGIGLSDFGATVAYHDATPTGRLLICRVISGHYSVQTRKATHRFDGSGAYSFRPDVDTLVHTENLTLESVSLDLELLDEVARTLGGARVGHPQFLGGEPVTPGRAEHWKATVGHVKRHVLANDELMTLPVVRLETARALASAALVTFPNSALDALSGRVPDEFGPRASTTVRRATEYIDAHAADPVTIEDIARVAGISPRRLQIAFRRHRDQTPLQYLREVRLASVHRDLLDADPTGGDTVASIAARWGFTHLGRFATHYQEAFGCRPRATLMR